MTLLTDQTRAPLVDEAGRRLATPGLHYEPATHPELGLPAGWFQGHDVAETYCPVGVVPGGGLGATHPFDNVQTEQPDPTADFDGIGCAWREMGTTEVQATVDINPQSVHMCEFSPLFHVTPEHPWFGVGAWLSSLNNTPPTPPTVPPAGIIWVTYLANPCTAFGTQGAPLAVAPFTRSTTLHRWKWRSTNGELELYDGDELVPMTYLWLDGGPANPAPPGDVRDSFTVHPDLASSTLHGFAIDAHHEHPDASRPLAAGNFDTAVAAQMWLSGVSS